MPFNSTKLFRGLNSVLKRKTNVIFLKQFWTPLLIDFLFKSLTIKSNIYIYNSNVPMIYIIVDINMRNYVLFIFINIF